MLASHPPYLSIVYPPTLKISGSAPVLIILQLGIELQWNLSIMDTLGTAQSVLIRDSCPYFGVPQCVLSWRMWYHTIFNLLAKINVCILQAAG